MSSSHLLASQLQSEIARALAEKHFRGTPFRLRSRIVIPDTTDMTQVRDLTDDDEMALARKATHFLTSFRWCAAVKESFLAFDCGEMLGVFLFCIEPLLLGVDETLWVVVGDVPPAFLVCDDAPDWYCALKSYVREMRKWIDAVRLGTGLDGIIPVNVSPTLEHADMLSSRLDFIQDHFIDDKPFPTDGDA